MPDPDIFGLFGLARYTPAGGRTFHVRATMASDVFERRIIERRRPKLEGPAPCDDTGPNNDTFDIALLFADRDPGIPGVSEKVYPNYHAAFMRETRVEGTATFYFPGRGEKRVRLKRRTSTQTERERNCEIVNMSLVEDGEDERAGADTFTLPTAKSAGPILVRQFAEAARPIGFGGDLLAALEAAVGALEAAVNAPFEAAAEVGRRADRVVDLCVRIRRLHTAPVLPFELPAFAPLLPPEAALSLALLTQIEASAVAARPSLFGTGTVRPRRFSQRLSIYEIAAMLRQPVDDLIRMNGALPLYGIPAGTVVLTKAA